MKETKRLIGTLLPAHPELVPIIQAVREKYNLPEISPNDEPIREIFFEDEPITFEAFRLDIEERIRSNPFFLPPDTVKGYEASRLLLAMGDRKEIEILDEENKQAFKMLIEFIKKSIKPIVQLIDLQFEKLAKRCFRFICSQAKPKKSPKIG